MQSINSVYGMISVIVIAFAALAAIAMILLAIRRFSVVVGKTKVSAGEGEVMPQLQTPTCADFQNEHTAILQRLEGMMTRLINRSNIQDEVQGALLIQAGITQKFIRKAEGRATRKEDRINGDLDEADDALKEAKRKFQEGRRIEG